MPEKTLTYSNFTGVILAGGLNSRMHGNNKALLEFDGHTILERQLALLQSIFPTVMIVGRDPKVYKNYDVRVVQDIYDYRSSMTGLHAGLHYMETPYAFVTACDSPFVTADMVRLVVEQTAPPNDWVLPTHDGHYEPLCSVYGKRCLPHLSRLLETGKVSILKLFDLVDVKYIYEQDLRRADPEYYSFINVNTPEQLTQALELYGKISGKFSTSRNFT